MSIVTEAVLGDVCCLQVNPVHSDGRPLGDTTFVRTGLLGFLGPVSVLVISVTSFFDFQFLFCFLFFSRPCDLLGTVQNTEFYGSILAG